MSELEQHDFSELESHGRKSLHAKKLKRWREAVGTGTNEMLPSSSTNPAAAGLVSSESLPSLPVAERSPQHVESKDSGGGRLFVRK